jgi:thioredoxin 1
MSSCPDRNEFRALLAENPGKIVLKFGADWCEPCKKLEPLLQKLTSSLPPTVRYIQMDLASDLGAFLKSKRQIVAVPVLLVYKKGNLTPYSDQCLTGPTNEELQTFFSRL